MKKSSYKYKLLSFEELAINLDRLSRFKLPEDSYNRVFSSIIFKCLISPKYSRQEIENLDPIEISNIVKIIWNDSVASICKNKKQYSSSHNLLKLLVQSSFKNIDKRTCILINTKLNITPILQKLDFDKVDYNLKFLIKADNEFENIENIREKYSLKFPIKKLLIVEGITEEILLPVFARQLKHSFEKEGIYVMGAGGKSKSPSLYLQLKNRLKIPITLLFDADANEIYEKLNKCLLKKDSAYIIEKGEFEDILSLNLIKRSLNREYLPATPIALKELRLYKKMCMNIEEFYKSRKLGEYKKAKLSKIIAKNVKYKSDITTDIKELISVIL